METQSDVPTRETVLFTDCFKATLVLPGDTQRSVTGKMGEGEDGVNKKIQGDVNQQHHVDDTYP